MAKSGEIGDKNKILSEIARKGNRGGCALRVISNKRTSPNWPVALRLGQIHHLLGNFEEYNRGRCGVWIISKKRPYLSELANSDKTGENYKISSENAKKGIEVDVPCGLYLTSVHPRIGEL